MSPLGILPCIPTSSRGLGPEAEYIAKAAAENRRRLRRSESLGLDSSVFEDLASVARDCSEADWDGYEAVAVDQETFRNAYRFLEALPLGTSTPSVGAEPDGHVTLEWHRSEGRTLSVSISPEGDLHYAALIGPNRAYGTEVFFGEVPEPILDLIRRVCAA
jgi:hypothetical protein